MVDWDWLWVIGELGVSYGFYRWWKSNDTFLTILQVAPDFDIDDLKQFSSLTTSIDYATIHGIVQTNDSKPHSVLKSQFIPDCIGVLHRLTIREQKLEKTRNVWSSAKNLISDVTRYVPFRLVSPKGNSIHIDKPLKFTSIKDQLEVTHVKFQPHVISAVHKFVDSLTGNISTGIETTEQMLLVNIPLTGIGRLEKQSGIWHLIPHEQWGGVLTRSSRKDIVSGYQTRSTITRLLSIIFGIVASCTAAYLIYQYYSRQQRQTNFLLPSAPPAPIDQRNEEDIPNNRLQCVICFENEIIYSLQPCSHLGLCQTCAQSLQARNHEQELCPICRAPIQQYQRVFLP